MLHNAPGVFHNAPGAFHNTPGAFRNVARVMRNASRVFHNASRVFHNASRVIRSVSRVLRNPSRVIHSVSGVRHQASGISNGRLGVFRLAFEISHALLNYPSPRFQSCLPHNERLVSLRGRFVSSSPNRSVINASYPPALPFPQAPPPQKPAIRPSVRLLFPQDNNVWPG